MDQSEFFSSLLDSVKFEKGIALCSKHETFERFGEGFFPSIGLTRFGDPTYERSSQSASTLASISGSREIAQSSPTVQMTDRFWRSLGNDSLCVNSASAASPWGILLQHGTHRGDAEDTQRFLTTREPEAKGSYQLSLPPNTPPARKTTPRRMWMM